MKLTCSKIHDRKPCNKLPERFFCKDEKSVEFENTKYNFEGFAEQFTHNETSKDFFLPERRHEH